MPAPSLGPGSGQFLGSHHFRVGPHGGSSTVPGLPVGVAVAGQRFREGLVDLPPLGSGRGLVHRRADQGVTKRQRRSVLDEQPRVDCRLPVGVDHAQGCGGPPHHLRFAAVVGRREEQHGLHQRRQAGTPVEEQLLDAEGQVELRRQRLRTRDLVWVSSEGSSSNARGSPPVSAMIRSMTPVPVAAPNAPRAALGPRPVQDR